jgi:Domain of unknown function (DUF1707)/Domain of unknown function (DUF4190)
MTDQSSQWPGWDPASPAPQSVQDSAEDPGPGPTQQQPQAGAQAGPPAEQQAWYQAQDTQYRTQEQPRNQELPQDQYQPQDPAQYRDPAQYQGQPQYQGQAQYRPQAPTQYPGHGQAIQGRYYPPSGVASAMRAGSADRERTVDVLRAGFAEGRLTQDEYNDRMNRAYEARTYGELHALVADLPVGPVPSVVPPMWQPAPVTRTNSLATASMVLGIAEFATMGVTALPAVICGHIARRQMRQTAEQGDGMAITGLVLGYLGILFWVALFAGLAIAVSGHGGGASPVFPGSAP